MNDPGATLAWRQLTDRNTSRKVSWPSKVPRIDELQNTAIPRQLQGVAQNVSYY